MKKSNSPADLLLTTNRLLAMLIVRLTRLQSVPMTVAETVAMLEPSGMGRDEIAAAIGASIPTVLVSKRRAKEHGTK